MQPYLSSGSVNETQLNLVRKKLQLFGRIRSGASWFFWIAGLSILNTILYMVHINVAFVVGLGITQAVDGIAQGLAESLGEGYVILRIVGLLIDVGIAGVFLLCGYFGRKRNRWAIAIGLVIYILDALILLAFGDWLSVLFHGLAIMGLFVGLMAAVDLHKLEQSGAGVPIDELRQQMAAPADPFQPVPSPRKASLNLEVILIAVIVVLVIALVAVLVIPH